MSILSPSSHLTRFSSTFGRRKLESHTGGHRRGPVPGPSRKRAPATRCQQTLSSVPVLPGLLSPGEVRTRTAHLPAASPPPLSLTPTPTPPTPQLHAAAHPGAPTGCSPQVFQRKFSHRTNCHPRENESDRTQSFSTEFSASHACSPSCISKV